MELDWEGFENFKTLWMLKEKDPKIQFTFVKHGNARMGCLWRYAFSEMAELWMQGQTTPYPFRITRYVIDVNLTKKRVVAITEVNSID